MRLTHLIPQIFLFLLSTTAKSFSKSKDAVLLSSVRTLTLHASKLTSHRRIDPIPQLNCVGGNAKGLYDVDIMRCKNSGSEYDAEDIQWTCQASLPPEFKLGSTEVVCEGYDSPDDPSILKGSCGVEYRLVLTEMGEEKYKRSNFEQRPMYDFGKTESGRGSGKGKSLGDTLWSIVFWFVFIAILCTIVYKIFFRTNGLAPTNRGYGFGGGGGGGGGGDNDDPPPPYTPRAPPRSKPATPRSAPSRNTQTQSASSGPGFWSGAAAAGAAGYGAGYFMGGRGRDSNRERERQRERSRERARERERERQYQSSMYGSSGSGSSSAFGNLFGGGGGGRGPGPSGSGSAPAPSSSRYESTGFGGTRRR